MSAWTYRSDTRDPAIIAEEREARSCQGCHYRGKLWGMWICDKKGTAALKRCKHFKESVNG